MTKCDIEIGYCHTHKRPLDICEFETEFNTDELKYIRHAIHNVTKGINTREIEILDKIAIKLGEQTIDEVLEGREY